MSPDPYERFTAVLREQTTPRHATTLAQLSGLGLSQTRAMLLSMERLGYVTQTNGAWSLAARGPEVRDGD